MGEGKGNYGCLGIVDFVAGTSLGDDVVDDVREEGENNHAQERVKGRAKKTGRKPKSRSRS